MKKFMAMLLALVMALSLVACGQQGGGQSQCGQHGSGLFVVVFSHVFASFPVENVAWHGKAQQNTPIKKRGLFACRMATQKDP